MYKITNVLNFRTTIGVLLGSLLILSATISSVSAQEAESKIFFPIVQAQTPPSTFYTYENKCFSENIVLEEIHFRIDTCTSSIEVLPDKTMKFHTTWTSTITFSLFDDECAVFKQSDEFNTAIYVTDDQSNKYDHTEVGGAAYETSLCDGEAAEGWFLFPAASSDANTFTFHISGKMIEDLKLE